MNISRKKQVAAFLAPAMVLPTFVVIVGTHRH